MPDYRCRSKSRYSCALILQILRGIAQDMPTAYVAAELLIDRSHLVARPSAPAEGQ